VDTACYHHSLRCFAAKASQLVTSETQITTGI